MRAGTEDSVSQKRQLMMRPAMTASDAFFLLLEMTVSTFGMRCILAKAGTPAVQIVERGSTMNLESQ